MGEFYWCNALFPSKSARCIQTVFLLSSLVRENGDNSPRLLQSRVVNKSGFGKYNSVGKQLDSIGVRTMFKYNQSGPVQSELNRGQNMQKLGGAPHRLTFIQNEVQLEVQFNREMFNSFQ